LLHSAYTLAKRTLVVYWAIQVFSMWGWYLGFASRSLLLSQVRNSAGCEYDEASAILRQDTPAGERREEFVHLVQRRDIRLCI
jgi:hypothetical protein